MATPNITAITVSPRLIEAVGGLRSRAGAKPVWQRRYTLDPETDRDVPFREIKALAGTDAVTIALSPDASMVRLFRLPPAEDREVRAMVELQMARRMPFPGEDVVIGHEIVRRTEDGIWVLAAAVPLASLNALDDEARAAGLRVVRVDLTMLGIWQRWRACRQTPEPERGRSALLVRDTEGLSLLVLEAGAPVMARRLTEGPDAAQLGLELTRSLMNLEMEQGAEPLVELYWIASEPPAPDIQAQVRAVLDVQLCEVSAGTLESSALGVAQRTMTPGTLNVFPSGWTVRGAAQRTRRRIMLSFAAALALWLGIVGLLWGGPYFASQALDEVRRTTANLAPAYHQVSELRDRVRLIQRYTDRSRSFLESFRAASLLLPEGIEVTSLSYRREDGLRLAGESLSPERIYTFKERIDNAPVFGSSTLTGPTWDQRRQRHVFELAAQWREAPE